MIEFITKYNNNLITECFKMRNEKFNEMLSKFNFRVINTKEDCNFPINKSKTNIIVIDEFKERNTKYFILYYSFNIILVSSQFLYFLKCFFDKKVIRQIFYTFSEEIKQNFIENIKPNNNLEFVAYNKLIDTYSINKYLTVIDSFSKPFKLVDLKMQSLWKIFERAIIYYLVLDFIKNNDNIRSKNYQNHFTKQPTIELQENDYITLKYLGKGSSSTVKLIYSIKNERILALKYLNDNKNIESIKLFNREKNNYLKLHHPFLLRYYGEIKSKYLNGMLLEYVDGTSLRNIKQLELNLETKIKLIFQIVIVFDYLHHNRYIYRDLKPDNIMIHDNNSPILIDLGGLIEIKNEGSINVETLDFFNEYVPPEINETSNITLKYDIYCLGLIILYILFEKDPKEILDFTETKATFKNLKIFDGFPSKYSTIKQIVGKCISFDPEKRPDISELFTNFYNIILSDSPKCLSIANKIKQYEDTHLKRFFNYWYLILGDGAFSCYEIIDFLSTNNFDDEVKKLQFVPKYTDDFAENLCNVGVCYFLGEFIKRDENKGLLYLEMAIIKNNKNASSFLSTIYLNNKSEYYDISKGLKYLAHADYALALYYTGLLYLNGIYYDKVINVAFIFIELACNEGCTEAIFFMGKCYLSGFYFETNIELGIYYLDISASKGHIDSIIILVQIYNQKDTPYYNMN